MAASGAAFLTVVFAPTANAFACRSTRRPAWRVPWTSNRFLLAAASLELAFAVGAFVVPGVPGLLDHRWPPAATWIGVVLAVPVMLAADGLWKRLSSRSATKGGPSSLVGQR